MKYYKETNRFSKEWYYIHQVSSNNTCWKVWSPENKKWEKIEKTWCDHAAKKHSRDTAWKIKKISKTQAFIELL